MKYFFLAENWTTARVWEFGGLWDELAWKRKPYVQKQELYIRENGENLWLYKAEDAIIMIEVKPKSLTHPTIGQVVLKRLLSAKQVIDRLCQEDSFLPTPPHQHDELQSSAIVVADDYVRDDDETRNDDIQPLNSEPKHRNDVAKSDGKIYSDAPRQIVRLMQQLTPFRRVPRSETESRFSVMDRLRLLTIGKMH
ncbi:MAG: hypothetical protein AAFU53_18540 [Cyanobacteria bacterium J06632_3]